MSIFTKQLAFEPIDPLGDGLREAIEAERREPEAISLEEADQATILSERWQDILGDFE